MIQQTKVLKQLLKKHNATGPFGDKLKVRITKTKHGEYGCAEAFVGGLTHESMALMKEENPRVKFHMISASDIDIVMVTY
ncbi:MAG: hypothetical protein LC650_04535 [Actinobacteria bacterium]|nr:hypothetical protein [Actinomycetota bacterium]